MTRWRKRLLGQMVAALIVLAASGCGLRDYQSRMDEQRKRVQEIDEFHSLLDDPIEMPVMLYLNSKEEKPAWPFEIYLRLPKGYGMTPKDKTPYYIPCFRYSGGDPAYSVFIAAANLVESDAKQDVGKYTAKNFRVYVKRAIEDFYVKTYDKFKLTLPEKVEERSDIVKSFALYPDEGKPMLFKIYEYYDTANVKTKDHSVFRVHLHEDGARQICIVEQRPLRMPNEAHDKAFRACLRTLDMSPEAATKRSQFKKARGF